MMMNTIWSARPRPSQGAVALSLALVALAGCGRSASHRPQPSGSGSNDPDVRAHAEREAHDARMLASPPCADAVHLDVRYGDRSPHQVMDVIVPEGGSGPRPAILWVHGGGWSGGELTSVAQYALRFVCEGYVVVSVGYHLSWEAPFRTPLLDVQNAVRAIREDAERYRVDPDKIVLWGASAGAHLVALAALTHDWPAVGPNPRKSVSARISGAITWWTPTDFLTMGDEWPARCGEGRVIEHRDSNESRMLGCIPSQCPDAARAASALTYVRADAPPMLLMHGRRDCTVPIAQSESLHRALEELGAPVTFVAVEEGAHGGAEWGAPEAMGHVRRFLARAVAGP